MNTKTYEATCALTKNLDKLKPEDIKPMLAIGLAGEVGEVCNILKKRLYYTQYNIDIMNLKDELGDCLYYLTNLITDCGWSLDEIMEVNSEKVKNILARKMEEQ